MRASRSTRRAMKYTVAADALAKIEYDGKEGHAGAKPRTVIEARPDARRDERRSRGARIGLARIGSDWIGFGPVSSRASRVRTIARRRRVGEARHAMMASRTNDDDDAED